MVEYPVTLIPDSFISDSSFHQLLRERTKLLQSLDEPKRPSSPNYGSTVPTVTTLLISIFLTAVISVNIDPIIGFLVLGFGIYLIVRSESNRSKNEELKTKYQNESSQYLERKEAYENQLKRINELSAKLKELREQAYLSPRSNILNYKNVDHLNLEFTKSKKIQKKGSEEEKFYHLLKRVFGDKVKNDIILTVDYSDMYGTKIYDLEPDIVYMDLDKQLLIDIEIDEPYDLNKKSPIHYKSEEEMPGSDEWRNDQFLRYDWFVFRFAEEQIVKQPDECVNYITGLINTIEGKSAQKHTLNRIKRWTHSEAFKMARTDYRYTYLNKLPF